MFEKVKAKLGNIQQSYPGHMDIMLNELSEAEKQITQLRAEVERLKPLAEIGYYAEMALDNTGLGQIRGIGRTVGGTKDLIQWGKEQESETND